MLVSDPSNLQRRSLAKVRHRILAYIILGQALYQLCKTNIGFAQLTMGKELGLKAEAFGLAAGIFALSGFLMQLPAGFLLEKYGTRIWLTLNMVLWGLVVVAQGFVTNGTQLVVLRFFLGIFEAGFLPGVYVLISVWFRGRDQGMATSFITMGLGLSALVGSPFAGWVIGKHLLGLAGWRDLFIIEGAITVVWTIIALRILTDDPRRTQWLEPEEQEFMSSYLSEYRAEQIRHGATTTSGMLSLLSDSRVVTLIISYLCAGFFTATVTFFTPTLLKTAGHVVSNQYVGYLAMGPYVFGALVSFFWGKHSDRTERHWHCILPLLVCAVGIGLFPMAKTPLIAMLCLMLVQAGNVCFFVNFWPSCNLVIGKEGIAKATSLINAGTMVGSFIGPICFGYALDATGKTTVGLYICVGVVLLNFVVMNSFFLRYKAQRRSGSGSDHELECEP